MFLQFKWFNTPEDRSKILYQVYKPHVEIMLLQEIHFKGLALPNFPKKYYTQWIDSANFHVGFVYIICIFPTRAKCSWIVRLPLKASQGEMI